MSKKARKAQGGVLPKQETVHSAGPEAVTAVVMQPAYEVIKPFKYNGRMYQRGEEWKPEGGAWDRLIMKQGEHVLPIEDKEQIRVEKVQQATKRLEQMPGYAK